MRCHRCHSKIDPGRKTCPNCGTLVRKRRGSVTLAPEAGGAKLTAFFKNVGSKMNLDIDINPKVVLLFAIIVAAVLLIFGVARCDGCSECGGCSECSTCSTCGSCDGCSSCGACGNGASGSDASGGCASCGACTTCSACGSCSVCSECGTCGNCGACEKCGSDGEGDVDTSKYTAMSAPSLSREYWHNGTLYYINGNNIMAMGADGTLSIVAESSGMSDLYVDGTNAYYLKGGNLWAVPLKKPETLSTDPAEVYGESRIINATVSGTDAGLKAIYGYGVTDGWICYWGPDWHDNYAVCCRPLAGGTPRVLRTGAYYTVECYGGSVYLLGRDEADYGMLYRIDLATGAKAVMYKEQVNYYTLCQGCVYAVTWKNHVAELHRLDPVTGEEYNKWVIAELSSLFANDRYIYYGVNGGGVGHIYRMLPDGTECSEIFCDDSYIQLTGVTGDWFSLYTDLDMQSNERYKNAVYYVVNGKTGESFALN